MFLFLDKMLPISIKASFHSNVRNKTMAQIVTATKAPGEQGVALGCEGANEHCRLLIAAHFS